MTDIFLMTFNCGKSAHPDFATHMKTVLPLKEPHFFVFGFQELLSIWDSTYLSKVNTKLIQLNNEIQNVLKEKYSGSFNLVKIEKFGSVGQIILTKKEVIELESSYVSIGYLHSNLKAAVGVRFKYEGETYTFITAHLTANEGFVEKRNADYWNVVRSLKFKEGLFEIASHTFFQGDLNYRRKRRESNENDEENENESSLLLMDTDELNIVRKDQLAFVSFKEEEVLFKPTYKYIIGTKSYDFKRIPSWCDRILFTSTATVHKYDSLRSLNSSDHEPVYLYITVNIPGAPIVQDGKLIVDVPEHLKGLTFDDIDPLQRQIGNIIDYIIWLGLWLVLTIPGRTLLGITGVSFLYKQLF